MGLVLLFIKYSGTLNAYGSFVPLFCFINTAAIFLYASMEK